MRSSLLSGRRSTGGFTLVEMAMSFAIVTLVAVGTFNVFISFLRSYNTTTLTRTATTRASIGMDRIIFGVGTNAGLREAVATSVTVTYSNGGWTLTYSNALDSAVKYFKYTTNKLMIVDWSGKLICTNVLSSTATNYSNGCQLTLSVAESGGGRIMTNGVTTFVQYRN